MRALTRVMRCSIDQYFRANGRGGDFALDLEFCTTTRAMEGKRRAAATAISSLNYR
jgi:hypothetical protein